jgi:hypothetical protein
MTTDAFCSSNEEEIEIGVSDLKVAPPAESTAFPGATANLPFAPRKRERRR